MGEQHVPEKVYQPAELQRLGSAVRKLSNLDDLIERAQAERVAVLQQTHDWFDEHIGLRVPLRGKLKRVARATVRNESTVWVRATSEGDLPARFWLVVATDPIENEIIVANVGEEERTRFHLGTETIARVSLAEIKRDNPGITSLDI